MLKLPITYRNIDGIECTNDFYFNISIPEATELATRRAGGFAEHLQTIVDKKSGAELIAAMTEFIKLAYGVRVNDELEKSEQATARFMASDAYSELFMRLVTEANFAATFITGLFPKDLQERVAHMQIANELEGQFSTEPPKERDINSYTKEEFMNMPEDEFLALRRKHRHNAPQALLLANFDRNI